MVREITKKFEEVLRGKVSHVLKQVERKPLKGEIVLVIAGAGAKTGKKESDALLTRLESTNHNKGASDGDEAAT